MDLVASAKNIIVAMMHTNPKGESKLLPECSLPLTGVSCVRRIVSDMAVAAEVIVYDAGGAEVQRATLATSGGVAQMRVTASVVNGRATVRFLSGRGRGYASIIDNGTGDATFFSD